MGQLYERAEIYDLIESEQRTASIRKDWEMFLGERPIKTFLDVSIGTGGMTLPLQELGMELFGSDLSEAMLARCREKALAKQKPFELQCSDFRDLSCWGDRQFDCVASTGNALGYVAAAAAYKDGREWFDAAKTQIWSNYELVRDAFELVEIGRAHV